MKKLLSIFTAIAMVATTSSVIGCKTQENTKPINSREEINISKLIVERNLSIIETKNISIENIKQKIKRYNEHISDEILENFNLEISEFSAKVKSNNHHIIGEIEVKFIPVDDNLSFARKAVYDKNDSSVCEKIGYFKNLEGEWRIEGFDPNTQVVPKELPWFVTILEQAFYQNKNETITNIDQWDTSNVTDMNWMFKGARNFNQSLEKWNTSNVVDMSGMFANAHEFNGNISAWNTSSVIKMHHMFDDARSFTQDISSWDTSSVEDMHGMFYGAESFNGNINTWDVSKVINMNNMFTHAKNFNQALNNWNTEKVIDMGYMFSNADKFNQDISNWNVENVRNWAGFSSNKEWLKEHQPKFRILIPRIED